MTLTVRKVLERVFPPRSDGTFPYYKWPVPAPKDSEGLGDYALPPILPFDVFAISAHLLEISGAYHHIWAATDTRDWRGKAPTGEDPRAGIVRRIIISREEIEDAREIARVWRLERRPDDGETNLLRILRSMWRTKEFKRLNVMWRTLFGKHGDEPVFKPLLPSAPPPPWWRTAHALMMISDEASQGVGFVQLLNSPDMPWFEQVAILSRLPDAPVPKPDAGKARVASDADQTDLIAAQVELPDLCSLSDADPDMVCVLPKGRTTPVGCTMRSLSHHLALLPAQGIARAHWHHPPPGEVPSDQKELNLLLVPYPFEVANDAFSGVTVRTDYHLNWGFFELRQSWLPDKGDTDGHRRLVNRLDNFIAELRQIAVERHNAKTLDAVVFPEMALTYSVYLDLVARLTKSMPGIEFIVAGLSTDDSGNKGNFVAITTFEKSTKDEKWKLTHIREKHHRWKISPRQVDQYCLGGGINPRLTWWEDIDLLSRRVEFAAFRGNSILTAMVCEDLARVDPCQELIRSIGPNLIIALLMDGPQLSTRWPARYATVLAEDPGCSVLTLTSRALMNRQHRKNHQFFCSTPMDWVIALWRDDNSENIQIECPPGCHAVWLKLWSSRATDMALDGRNDEFGKTWTYGKHTALQLDLSLMERRYGDLFTKGVENEDLDPPEGRMKT